jgi:hypothetical protein
LALIAELKQREIDVTGTSAEHFATDRLRKWQTPVREKNEEFDDSGAKFSLIEDFA